MKNKEKKMILILILISIIIIGILYFATRPKTKETVVENTVKEEFVQVLEDGTKFNISSKLKEEKNIDGLKIGNIQLTEKKGQLVLLADVTNTTVKDVQMFSIEIVLYDKNGNEIGTIPGIVPPVKAGKTEQLNAGITDDYSNAYDFKIVKK